MRKLFIILFILLSNFSFSQEWISYNYTFEFSDVSNKEDLKNIFFKYIDNARTQADLITYRVEENQFNIVFETMGGGIILVLEKENETMYILLEDSFSYSKPEKTHSDKRVIFSNFKKGYYQIRKDELIEWKDEGKHSEWIQRSDVNALKLVYR